MHELFRKFAARASTAMGSSWAFMLALASILIWAATGPIFHYSDTWHLVVNDWTNIVTFFMVFLIQNMQNRDAKAMQLKLDELIKATKGARNSLMNLERLTDEEMNQLEGEYKRLCAQHINGNAKPALVPGIESTNS
jgi:low affinity Fe/Cu permease